MKIAVNARMLTQRNPGGIARYAHETLKRITDRHREHEFLFIVDRPFPGRDAYPGNVAVVRTFPSFHLLLWYPWFELSVPRILKKFEADLFLSPDGYCCLSTAVPTAVVIHDLNFHHNPEDMPVLISRYYNHFFPRFAKKAKTIATVSEYSKRDIVNLYGVPPEKIIVTYCGAGETFCPLPEEEIRKVREEITGGAPYFLSVGAIHPRKNLVRLIEAFEKFKIETADRTKLVLVGPLLFKTGEVFKAWRRISHKEDVIFPGVVSEAQLRRIYSGAHAFMFVSCFEGFGMPALESMGCEVPVVAAAGTSLPEVCGDAALLVDPFSVDAITGAMKSICFDETLRKNLVEKGKARIKFFDWDKTAGLLWEAIERSVS
ncbi:MAG: glycosyltransferase family 1 protein [Deltaproteobacteria bacterium HGW-Deltaproteobacteria-13]|jgi:glycosyltransferase involved in cell wall biosynthesis|nr:MAG: glycosyltransferase family 1 protein [Deltaproteobacteria bacterium HGW-Deltaproteobacteria-13]